MNNLLSEIRRAGDNAAASQVDASGLVNSNWATASAAGDPYLIKCKSKARHLVVFLHSWGADYQQITTAFPELGDLNQVCVLSPNFNGPNNTPQALGSDDAIEKIDMAISEVMWKTGLTRIYMVAFSGGTLAAMNYMGKYPGKVHRASLWLPIYDLASLYSTTSDNSLKTDMVNVIGHAPASLSDPDYLARSPKSRLNNCYGPTTVFLNIGSEDTVAPPSQGDAAFTHFQSLNDILVTKKTWSIGHSFGANEKSETFKQLFIE